MSIHSLLVTPNNQALVKCWISCYCSVLNCARVWSSMTVCVCVYICMCTCVCFSGNRERWQFWPYVLWRTHKNTHTLVCMYTHTHTFVMSGFKFWLFSPGPRQLSSLCSKTPIIHLWHDSVLTAPLRRKKSYSLCLSDSRSLDFFFFSIFISPPLILFAFSLQTLVFILFSCLSSLFQLHFFPLNLLFLQKLLSGFDYSGEA